MDRRLAVRKKPYSRAHALTKPTYLKTRDEMHRRTFLKNLAIAIRTIAGMYDGVLEADGQSYDQEPVVTAHTSGDGVVEEKEEERLAWGTHAVVLAGIDVVYAGGDGLAQNSNRTGNVGRRPPRPFCCHPARQAASRHSPCALRSLRNARKKQR